MKRSRNKRGGVIGQSIRELSMTVSSFFRARNAVVIGGKFKSGVAVSDIVKYCIYAVLSLLLVLLETTFFARFRPFGASPDVLIIASASMGMYEGERAGAVFGLAMGFAASALGSVGVSLLPLVYMLTGYICGVVASDYYRRSVLLFLIFDVSALFLRVFTTLITIAFTWGEVDLSAVIAGVVAPEFMSTLVMSPLPALLFLPVWKIFDSLSENEK